MKLAQINLRNVDRTFWVLFIILIIVAILALFSAGGSIAREDASLLGPIAKQMAFIIAGASLAFAMQFLPTWSIRLGGYGLLIISCLCLYIMIVPGNPFVVNLNGAGRWFNLFGFQFQPSEPAKLALIIVVADQLSRIKSEEHKKKYFIRTLLITAFTCFPILVGNLSTTILLTGVVFLLWFLARIPGKYLWSVAGGAALLLIGGYFIVELAFVRPGRQIGGLFGRAETWVSRIDDEIETRRNNDSAAFKVTDDNYQRSMAMVAVARGGKSPLGVLPGNSQERDFLPLAYADYIFAIIVEETGIVGALFLIFLYMAILFRACYASSRYEDYSAMLMVMGVALLLTCQAWISMEVAVGLGPVTGQPLPMISRGGTSVLFTSLYFGIMMCVSREQNMLHDHVNQSETESYNNAPEIDIIEVK